MQARARAGTSNARLHGHAAPARRSSALWATLHPTCMCMCHRSRSRAPLRAYLLSPSSASAPAAPSDTATASDKCTAAPALRDMESLRPKLGPDGGPLRGLRRRKQQATQTEAGDGQSGRVGVRTHERRVVRRGGGRARARGAHLTPCPLVPPLPPAGGASSSTSCARRSVSKPPSDTQTTTACTASRMRRADAHTHARASTSRSSMSCSSSMARMTAPVEAW
jgi:hypothetical protein